MNVDVKKSFYKDVKKIPKDDAVKILKSLEELKQLSSLYESTHLKKIVGQENFFRCRVGNYRIVLRWNKKTQILTAETLGLRKDIYKRK